MGKSVDKKRFDCFEKNLLSSLFLNKEDIYSLNYFCFERLPAYKVFEMERSDGIW